VNVRDKTERYKIVGVGSKFVARTDEELVRLERLKAEQAARELTPAKGRMPRAKERFVITTVSQAERLLGLEHVCWPLFTILLFENFRHRGKPFTLPTDQLTAVKGLSRANLHRALVQLEARGLVSVVRNPPQPPLITVLLSHS
jgi:hypothetical protein